MCGHVCALRGCLCAWLRVWVGQGPGTYQPKDKAVVLSTVPTPKAGSFGGALAQIDRAFFFFIVCDMHPSSHVHVLIVVHA